MIFGCFVHQITYRGPVFRALLLFLTTLVFTVSLDVRQTAAQVQIYYYIGPGYNLSDCIANPAFGASPPCIANGSITGSLTLKGVSTGYSGSLTKTAVSSWNLEASGIGSLSTGDTLGNVNLTLTNGQITSWLYAASDNVTGLSPDIQTSNAPGGYDVGSFWVSGVTTKAGFVQNTQPPVGHWSNPKSFGSPCGHSGGCFAERRGEYD